MFRRETTPEPLTYDDPSDLTMAAVAGVEADIIAENEKAKRNGAIKHEAHHRKINELLDERDALLSPPVAPPVEAPAVEFIQPETPGQYYPPGSTEPTV